MNITIDRSLVEQALEALELLQNAIYNIGGEHVTGWGYANDAADSAEKPITTLKAALVEPQEPVQEPVAWRYQDARGNYRYRGYVQGFDKEYSLLKPVPLYAAPPQRPAEPVQELPWLRAIDEAMIDHHVGVADPADDYETAKRKLNNLLCHAQDIGAYFAKQAEPVQEPVQTVALWGLSGNGYSPVFLEQAEPPEPLTVEEALAKGWRRFYSSPPKRAEPVQEPDNGGKTGWPPGLLQDDCRGLSKWLASRPDARQRLREALAEPVQDTNFDRWWDNALDGPTPVAPVSKETARWIWNAAKAEPVQEPVQEPVAETSAERTLKRMGYTDCGGQFWKPPLGAPAQPQEPVQGPKPLSYADALRIATEAIGRLKSTGPVEGLVGLVRAVEAAHGIGKQE